MEENETANETADQTPDEQTPPVVVEPPVIVEPPVVVEPPATVVVPEGYVKSEEVETERTARTAAEERATAAEQRARTTEIKAAAQALNFNDPSDAERFVGADVEDVSAALAEVLAAKPYLAKQAEVAPVVTPTSPTNPARGAATLTLESMKSMTPAQLAGQWDAVKTALKANQ